MYPRAEVGFHFPAQVLVCLALAALAWAEGPAPGLPPDAFSPAPPATTSPESPGDAPVEAPTASPPPHAPGNEWADEASPAPGSEAANEPEPAPPGTPLRLPAGNAVRHDDIQITASVDNSRPSIGDWVTYRLRAEGPEGIELRRAEIPEKMPDYLALKGRLASESRTENGRVSRTWEFLLDFYFSGQFPLPPIVVTYRGLDGTEKQVIAPLFLLDIQGLQLDPDHPADIRPNKPMRDIPTSRRRAWIITGSVLSALALASLGLFFLLRWWCRPEDTPPLPAHLLAYEQMRRLVEDRLVEQGRIEEYYVRLSDICRHYLENRFDLRAPECTTEEFLAEMAQTRLLTDHQKQRVRDFLGHCDLVKFARYGPTVEEMQQAFDAAKRLVDETRERTPDEMEAGAPEGENVEPAQAVGPKVE